MGLYICPVITAQSSAKIKFYLRRALFLIIKRGLSVGGKEYYCSSRFKITLLSSDTTRKNTFSPYMKALEGHLTNFLLKGKSTQIHCQPPFSHTLAIVNLDGAQIK